LEHSDEYGDTEVAGAAELDELGEMLVVDIPPMAGQYESL